MPTGYTADIADGKITDLAPFAFQLARGMGALIMMRDDPWDAPIPERFEPSGWNAEKLAAAKVERARLYAMPDSEAQIAADTEHTEFLADRDNARDDHNTRALRYKAMIDKVEAWQGAPEGIREFALEQLRSGMEFDCGQPFRFYREEPSTNGQVWKNGQLEKVSRDILYHAKEDAKERERTEGRNVWIAQLRASLS